MFLHYLSRSSIAVAFAVALLAVPLMVLLRSYAMGIAFVAVCAFALADPLLTVVRAWWWLSAGLSIVVGVVLLLGLAAVADALHPHGESAMVFLLPIFVHPASLGLAGVMRLGASRGLWSRSTSFVVALVLAVGGLMVMLLLPAVGVVVERITGNTAANTSYSGDEGAVVVSSTAAEVSVRVRGRVDAYRLTPATRFEFRGPGSGEQTQPCGPSWLTPGQRVQVEHVLRGGASEAMLVTVWVERRGCAPDWASPRADAADADSVAGLQGAVFEGWLQFPGIAARQSVQRWEFLEGGALAYSNDAGARFVDGRWRQRGRTVAIELNGCYAQYDGVMDGDAMSGSFQNVAGLQAAWSARRLTP